MSLKAVPIFAGLDAAALERLGQGCAEITAEPGQTLATADDPGSGMFVVLEGDVVVELRSARYELGPGAFFGELALLVPGAGRVGRVRAASRARCLTIPRDTFLELLDSQPTVARAMLDELARRLVETHT